MPDTTTSDWMQGMTDFQRAEVSRLESRAYSCERRFESLHLDEIEWKKERKTLRAELAGAIKQRDEARELYCRQIACGVFRATGVFDPQQIAIKRGWAGLFSANEPSNPQTAAPIHREPAPTPAPPPKRCFKEGGGA